MKNWVKYKLNEVCNIGDGNHSSNYPKSDEMVSEGIPFIRANNMVNGEVIWNDMKFITPSKHQILKKGHLKAGDILFTNRGEIGKMAIAGYDFENANLNSQIAWFRCLEKINNRFLFYFLASPSMKTYYSVEKNGAALQQFTIRQINEIEIPLPPLPEQQRIVSILDEAFAAIAKAKANAEQNLRNARELFESYLQGVFEKKGDGWELTILKKEIELIVGFAFKSKKYTELQDDILLVRGDNIMQGYFRWDEAKRWVKSEYNDYEKYQLKENDILLAMDRPWVKAGLKIARISKHELPALLVQRTACIRTKDKLDNSFLYHLLNSKRFMQYLIDVQTGIGVPHISGQQILDFEFRKPSIKEQQNVVNQLDSLKVETKKLEAIYQQKINDLDELKKSILQKAFNGELKTSAVIV